MRDLLGRELGHQAFDQFRIDRAFEGAPFLEIQASKVKMYGRLWCYAMFFFFTRR